MSKIYQQPISGPVEYKKGIYKTIDDRSINVHYFGDEHLKRTQCTDPHALSLLSLLVSSLKESENEVDVFVEIGLGPVAKIETHYLNELIKNFQKHYSCLLKGLENREKCKSTFPNVRFHNVDFRHTLYFEYMEVVNYIIMINGKTFKNSDLMLNMIEEYATELMKGSEYDPLRIPYPSIFRRDRELLRLTWIYDMIRARKNLYDIHRLTSFSENLEQFTIDLYYLIGISPSIKKNISLLPSPICNLYPNYLRKTPYYFYRLSHEYSTIPEVIKDILVGQRFDSVLREYLEKIRLSYRRVRFQFINATEMYPYKNIDEYTLTDFCTTYMSSFMDIYVCFRSLKPYVKNVIVICGVYHISNINQVFADLGLQSKTSPSFTTIDTLYDKGVQCISVPLRLDPPQLTFNDDLFNNMVYVRPSYKFRQKIDKKKYF